MAIQYSSYWPISSVHTGNIRTLVFRSVHTSKLRFEYFPVWTSQLANKSISLSTKYASLKPCDKNYVIMTSLPKTMAKFGPPQKQTNYISLESSWQELSKNVFFFHFEPLYQKLWPFLSTFCKFYHTLSPNMDMPRDSKFQILKILIWPYSALNNRKSRKNPPVPLELILISFVSIGNSKTLHIFLIIFLPCFLSCCSPRRTQSPNYFLLTVIAR